MHLSLLPSGVSSLVSLFTFHVHQAFTDIVPGYLFQALRWAYNTHTVFEQDADLPLACSHG